MKIEIHEPEKCCVCQTTELPLFDVDELFGFEPSFNFGVPVLICEKCKKERLDNENRNRD